MIRVPCRWMLSLAPVALAACSITEPAPELSTEEAMARATELGSPGQGHARLQPLVGTFSTTMTMWLEPGADPMVSEGTSINRWVLGGRYLHQDYKADFMGMPFEGIGTTAFDNSTGKYQGSWLDNMSSHMLPPSEGEWDEASRTITSRRNYTDPLSGQATTTRDVVRIVSDDEHHFEMHEARVGGEERKLFEIVYTRTK